MSPKVIEKTILIEMVNYIFSFNPDYLLKLGNNNCHN